MNKTLNTIIVTAIIASVAGYWVGYVKGGKAVDASGKAKIAAAEKLFPSQSKTLVVNGTVARTTDKSIMLERVVAPLSPLATDIPTTREVLITNATKITKIQQKSSAVYNGEMAAFEKAIQSRHSGVVAPPSPFTEVTISLSDIKAGDAVTASASEDILDASSFTAAQIQVSAIR